MIPPFNLLNFSNNQLLQRFQANVASVLQALVGVPIAQGLLATYTAPRALEIGAPFTLAHNLGRPVLGILPAVMPFSAFENPGAGASFVMATPASQTPNTSTSMTCSNEILAGAVLSFWVF